MRSALLLVMVLVGVCRGQAIDVRVVPLDVFDTRALRDQLDSGGNPGDAWVIGMAHAEGTGYDVGFIWSDETGLEIVGPVRSSGESPSIEASERAALVPDSSRTVVLEREHDARPYAFTPDLRVVVGSINTPLTRPARWIDGEVELLETLGVLKIPVIDPQHVWGFATGVSDDGDVVVGVRSGAQGTNSPTISLRRAFRWTPGSALELIEREEVRWWQQRVNVSANGRFIAGFGIGPRVENYPDGGVVFGYAYVHEHDAGFTKLGPMPDKVRADHHSVGVSDDGRVVTVYADSLPALTGSFMRHLGLWTPRTQTADLQRSIPGMGHFASTSMRHVALSPHGDAMLVRNNSPREHRLLLVSNLDTGPPTDLDLDLDTDLDDFARFARAFDTSLGDDNFDPRADLDRDNHVDLHDFRLFGEALAPATEGEQGAPDEE